MKHNTMGLVMSVRCNAKGNKLEQESDSREYASKMNKLPEVYDEACSDSGFYCHGTFRMCCCNVRPAIRRLFIRSCLIPTIGKSSGETARTGICSACTSLWCPCIRWSSRVFWLRPEFPQWRRTLSSTRLWTRVRRLAALNFVVTLGGVPCPAGGHRACMLSAKNHGQHGRIVRHRGGKTHYPEQHVSLQAISEISHHRN